jgi:hypothetical protein
MNLKPGGDRQSEQSTKPRKPSRSLIARVPLSILLAAALIAISLLFGFLRREERFSLAFGDALLFAAVSLYALAWLGYLKRDGVKFLSPRKSNAGAAKNSAESWKDRVPALGEPPSAPLPLPGDTGPNSPEYARLAEAETNLRKRILGEKAENSSERSPAKAPGRSFSRDAFIAGSLLLALALFFEYFVPLVAH